MEWVTGKVNVGKRKPGFLKQLYYRADFLLQIARCNMIRGWRIVKNPIKYVHNKIYAKSRRMYK